MRIVDKDGFTKVPGRPRPQAAHVLDCVARAAAQTRSANWFRPLTLDDLADIAEALPPRVFIGQGETVAVAIVALQESADSRTQICSLRESADCHTDIVFIQGVVTWQEHLRLREQTFL